MSSQDSVNPESSSGSNSKDAMFEPKPKPKMIRVLTVLAYVLSVSMAAILLSIYYIFMWDGRPHLGARRSQDADLMNSQNNSDRYPMTSKHIFHQDNSYNTSRDFPDMLQDEPSSDALLNTVNSTIINYYVEKDNTTTTYKDNVTDRQNQPSQELQQQITAIESDEQTISTTIPTTSEETSVTWPDDYDEVDKPNIFIKKVLGYDY